MRGRAQGHDWHASEDIKGRVYNGRLQSRGLPGGPETRGPGTRPGTRTGSGLYFKWSAGSGSGPNLLLRVPGLFNIPESIGEHRTREWSVSVSMRVCNLQFVKLGWEKCEREIRWKKKNNTRYLSRQKQSAGGVNVVAYCKRTVLMDSFMSDVKKKLKQNWRDAPVIEHARSKV